MKQHEAKEFLPLIKAWSEGGVIQIFTNLAWYDIKHDELRFVEPISNYRIKPTPKPPTYRPWTCETAILGCWLRLKGSIGTQKHCISMLVSKGENKIIDGQGAKLSYEYLFDIGEYSTDNGLTWNPCGVLIPGDE